MSARPGTPLAPRARAVSAPQIDDLLGEVDELARRWVMSLLGSRPLARMSEIPLARMAEQAPGLCAQILLALRSDAELERLLGNAPSADRRQSVAELLTHAGGSPGVLGAVETAEALRGVMWEALLERLGAPAFAHVPSSEVAEVGDRLAYVCSVALAVALGDELGEPPREAPASPAPSLEDSLQAQTIYRSGSAPGAAAGVAIVDELGEIAARRARTRGAPLTPAGADDSVTAGRGPDTGLQAADQTGQDAAPGGRPLPWDTPLSRERR
jgi:hypothetical protein